MTIFKASSANGRCSTLALSHGARIQTSRSSSVSKITRHIFSVDRLAEIRAQGAAAAAEKAARGGGLLSCSVCYCLFTPFCTAPGSFAEPVLFGPAAGSAPEVLASPRGEGGLLVPVVVP